MSYEVLLLPLNRPTVNGRIYTQEAIAGALESLKERVAAGDVLGEFGSPRARVGGDPDEAMRIDMRRHCLRVVELDLREDGLYGKIVAEGPMADKLVDAIETDKDSVPVMSMRSLSRLSVATPKVEETAQIITFDFDEQVAYAKHEANATPLSPAGGIAPHMEAVRQALIHDAEYAWSWFCNLKMPHIDAGASWTSASEGAARFLSVLTGGELDITKHPNWANNAAIDARSDAEKVDTFPEVPADQNVVNIIVEAPAHHGGQLLATAISQFLGKVLPNTSITNRMGDWSAETRQLHEAAISTAIENGQLDIDTWNEERLASHEFGVVVEMRPVRHLHHMRRVIKD